MSSNQVSIEQVAKAKSVGKANGSQGGDFKPDFEKLSEPGSESLIYELLALNILPDWLIRLGVRNMLATKIKEESAPDAELARRLDKMVEELGRMPVAIATESANEQHYMVPTSFFQYCLGPRLKYSCAYYEREDMTLAEAEEAMLSLTCARAEIEDGMEILELGCGWGSLTLYMAERFPGARITAVSNSSTQRAHIESRLKALGLNNVKVLTCDMNDFHYEGQADRVVSVEMFEHMKNYKELMKRIYGWLKPGGKLFVHVFSHKRFCYHYQDKDGSDWLTRNFFEGGIMPSCQLLTRFQDHMKLEAQFEVNGRHYQKTARHWLENMDKNKKNIMPLLASTYGAKHQVRWWVFWRLFYIACEELWGFKGGEEWNVSHYRFVRPV